MVLYRQTEGLKQHALEKEANGPRGGQKQYRFVPGGNKQSE